MNTQKMYHIDLTCENKAKYAIVTGDPGRVKLIAEYLDEPRQIAAKREYVTFLGKLDAVPVLVTSTGIGGPSAAIAVEELIKVGVHTFVRVGTCGAMQQNVNAGDLVIANGAIRMEGTSREYAPIEYPAVPHYDVLSCLVRSAGKLKANYHIGVVQSKDSFYGQHEPNSMPVKDMLLAKWDSYIKMGALASEMECAAIFTVCAARGKRAGAVLTVVWNQEQPVRDGKKKSFFDNKAAIKCAVGALRLLIEKENKQNML